MTMGDEQTGKDVIWQKSIGEGHAEETLSEERGQGKGSCTVVAFPVENTQITLKERSGNVVRERKIQEDDQRHNITKSNGSSKMIDKASRVLDTH